MGNEGIKKIVRELPFNLQVENLSVQIGDTHSNTYFRGNNCRCCDYDCGSCDYNRGSCDFDRTECGFDSTEPLPSWDEYSDFFTVDDDGFHIDMDKMAEKISKDTDVSLDTVKKVLYAESQIMDDLGIMEMVDDCSCDDCEYREECDYCDECGSVEKTDNDKVDTKNKHTLFEGLTQEQEREAIERLMKAVFPELKDMKLSIAICKAVNDKEEGADEKRS